MAESILVLAFPPDREIYPTTTPEDVLLLARALLKEKGVRNILQRVGEHKDFTEDKDVFVNKALIKVGAAYQKPGHHYDNLNIAIALARRFTSGSTAIDDEEAALTFVEERIRRFKHVNDHKVDFPRQRMKLSELLQFVENLKNNHPEYIDKLHAVRHMSDEEKRKLPDDYLGDLFYLSIVEGWKYGMANRDQSDITSLRFVLPHYAFRGHLNDGDATSLEKDELLRVMRGKVFMSTYGLTNEPRFIDDVKNKGEV